MEDLGLLGAVVYSRHEEVYEKEWEWHIEENIVEEGDRMNTEIERSYLPVSPADGQQRYDDQDVVLNEENHQLCSPEPLLNHDDLWGTLVGPLRLLQVSVRGLRRVKLGSAKPVRRISGLRCKSIPT